MRKDMSYLYETGIICKDIPIIVFCIHTISSYTYNHLSLIEISTDYTTMTIACKTELPKYCQSFWCSDKIPQHRAL